MPKRTAASASAVSPPTRNLFIGLAVLSVIMQAAVILYWVISQYPSNHNLSAYLLPAVMGIAAPVIFFATAYLLRQRTGRWKERTFDAVLFATMGMLASELLQQSTIFYQRFYIYNGGYWRSVLYTLTPLAVSYLIYVIFLLWYRD